MFININYQQIFECLNLFVCASLHGKKHVHKNPVQECSQTKIIYTVLVHHVIYFWTGDWNALLLPSGQDAAP